MLSEEIILDDIKVLREEANELFTKFQQCLAEMDRRVEEARKQGIEV